MPGAEVDAATQAEASEDNAKLGEEEFVEEVTSEDIDKILFDESNDDMDEEDMEVELVSSALSEVSEEQEPQQDKGQMLPSPTSATRGAVATELMNNVYSEIVRKQSAHHEAMVTVVRDVAASVITHACAAVQLPHGAPVQVHADIVGNEVEAQQVAAEEEAEEVVGEGDYDDNGEGGEKEDEEEGEARDKSVHTLMDESTLQDESVEEIDIEDKDDKVAKGNTDIKEEEPMKVIEEDSSQQEKMPKSRRTRMRARLDRVMTRHADVEVGPVRRSRRVAATAAAATKRAYSEDCEPNPKRPRRWIAKDRSDFRLSRA